MPYNIAFQNSFQDFHLDNKLKSLMLKNCRHNIRDFEGPDRRSLKALAEICLKEIAAMETPAEVTALDLICRLMIMGVNHFESYNLLVWQDSTRYMQLISIICGFILFSPRYPHKNFKNYFDYGDPSLLAEEVNPLCVDLAEHLRGCRFERELAIIKAHIADEINHKALQLPFSDNDRLATITARDYASMLYGNITATRRIVALAPSIIGDMRIKDYRPYWRDSGRAVYAEELASPAGQKTDEELLHVIYTELLSLYKQATPAQREAYKRGEAIAFNPRKMLRKMTQHPKTYNLFAKLYQFNDLYALKINRAQTGKMSLTKLLTVETYENDTFKLNAAALMSIIDDMEKEALKSSRQKSPLSHVYYLPMGGKKKWNACKGHN